MTVSLEPRFEAAVDPGDALTDTFTRLQTEATRLVEEASARLEMDKDAEAALELLLDIREALAPLRDLAAVVEAEACHRMRGKTLEWPGFAAERRAGANRVDWRHEDLAWDLLRPLAVNTETGEVNAEASVLLSEARAVLLECAAVTWRTGKLRERGLDAGDYSKVAAYRRTVTVRRVVAE
jgi:hypothetical protein